MDILESAAGELKLRKDRRLVSLHENVPNIPNRSDPRYIVVQSLFGSVRVYVCR